MKTELTGKDDDSRSRESDELQYGRFDGLTLCSRINRPALHDKKT